MATDRVFETGATRRELLRRAGIGARGNGERRLTTVQAESPMRSPIGRQSRHRHCLSREWR